MSFTNEKSSATSITLGTPYKFNPVTKKETIIINGVTTCIFVTYQCATVMKAYEGKSLEELRFEDYTANRRGLQRAAPGFVCSDEKPMSGETVVDGTFGRYGGTTIKFCPVTGTDSFIKHGITTLISTRNQCICAMREYEEQSPEELRLGDYIVGRRGPQLPQNNSSGVNQSAMFGNNSVPTSTNFSLNSNNPAIGIPNVFGSNTNSSASAFGQPTQPQFRPFEFGNGSVGFTAPNQSIFNRPFNRESNVFGSSSATQTKTPNGLFGSSDTSQPFIFGSPNSPPQFSSRLPFGESNSTVYSAGISTFPQRPQQLSVSSGGVLFGSSSKNLPQSTMNFSFSSDSQSAIPPSTGFAGLPNNTFPICQPNSFSTGTFGQSRNAFPNSPSSTPSSNLFGPSDILPKSTFTSPVLEPRTNSIGLFGPTNNLPLITTNTTPTGFRPNLNNSLPKSERGITASGIINSWPNFSTVTTSTATFSPQSSGFGEGFTFNRRFDTGTTVVDSSARTSGNWITPSDNTFTRALNSNVNNVEMNERALTPSRPGCLNSGTGFRLNINSGNGENNVSNLRPSENIPPNGAVQENDHNYAQTVGTSKRDDRVKLYQLERKCEDLANQVQCMNRALRVMSAIICSLQGSGSNTCNICASRQLLQETIPSSLQGVLDDLLAQQMDGNRIPATVITLPDAPISIETQTEEIHVSAAKFNSEVNDGGGITQQVENTCELMDSNEPLKEMTMWHTSVSVIEKTGEESNEPMESDRPLSPSDTNKTLIAGSASQENSPLDERIRDNDSLNEDLKINDLTEKPFVDVVADCDDSNTVTISEAEDPNRGTCSEENEKNVE